MDILLREAPFRFPGGIDVDAQKDQSTSDRIRDVPIPTQLILPITQHHGLPAELLVHVGDKVKKGQLLAVASEKVSANIHAPTSGEIVSIGEYPVPHPSALTNTCIRLIPDGEDMWVERAVTERDYRSMDNGKIIDIIRSHGIVGLGGAVFPSDIKLNSDKLTTLIINGAECEPYISCDDKLMQAHADEIIEGIKILMQITAAQRCVFAIENNKPEAIHFVKNALQDANDLRIELFSLPSVYPQGGEKQLIQSITGIEIPSGKLAVDMGYLMFNVGTVKAIRDAVIEDQPLISRVVTVTGDGVKYPQNVRALIGTPAYELIEFCGGYADSAMPHQLIMGGSLMGVSLSSDAVPVTKAMNCLLVATQKNTQAKIAQPCIRCGECAQVCPARLLPQQLYWYGRSKNYTELEKFNLKDCIECGACDLVCPSHIPLVQYFRSAKGEIQDRDEQKQLSVIAKDRFDFREQRLEEIASKRAKKLAAKKARTHNSAQDQTKGKKSAIDELMQRVKNKKDDNNKSPKSGTD